MCIFEWFCPRLPSLIPKTICRHLIKFDHPAYSANHSKHQSTVLQHAGVQAHYIRQIAGRWTFSILHTYVCGLVSPKSHTSSNLVQLSGDHSTRTASPDNVPAFNCDGFTWQAQPGHIWGVILASKLLRRDYIESLLPQKINQLWKGVIGNVSVRDQWWVTLSFWSLNTLYLP